MSARQLQLYGAEWCPKTALIRNYLQSEWLDFDYFNVEQDEAAADRVRALYDGKLKFPTVVIGEEHLKNPNVAALRQALKEKGVL